MKNNFFRCWRLAIFFFLSFSVSLYFSLEFFLGSLILFHQRQTSVTASLTLWTFFVLHKDTSGVLQQWRRTILSWFSFFLSFSLSMQQWWFVKCECLSQYSKRDRKLSPFLSLIPIKRPIWCHPSISDQTRLSVTAVLVVAEESDVLLASQTEERQRERPPIENLAPATDRGKPMLAKKNFLGFVWKMKKKGSGFPAGPRRRHRKDTLFPLCLYVYPTHLDRARAFFVSRLSPPLPKQTHKYQSEQCWCMVQARLSVSREKTCLCVRRCILLSRCCLPTGPKVISEHFITHKSANMSQRSATNRVRCFLLCVLYSFSSPPPRLSLPDFPAHNFRFQHHLLRIARRARVGERFCCCCCWYARLSFFPSLSLSLSLSLILSLLWICQRQQFWFITGETAAADVPSSLAAADGVATALQTDVIIK